MLNNDIHVMGLLISELLKRIRQGLQSTTTGVQFLVCVYACLTHYWHSNANIRSVTFGVCADRHTTTYALHCIHSIQCAETYVWDVHVLSWCVQTDDYDDDGRNEDVDKTNRHRRSLCGRRMRACVCLECVCERVARSQAARRPHVSPPLLLPGTRAHAHTHAQSTRAPVNITCLL